MTKFLTQGSDPNEDGSSNDVDVSPEFLKLLEATVLAAGKYVVPSDNLRPHTLEAAEEMDSDRRRSYQLVKYAALLAICGCIGLPLADQLSPWRERLSGRTSLQIQELALQKKMGPDWGLLEVFRDRQRNAAKSRQLSDTNSDNTTGQKTIEDKISE